MIAKAIIDLSNAIAITVFEAIEQGLEIAKVSMQTVIDETRTQLVNLEISVSTAIGVANSAKNTLPEIAGTRLGDLVTICTSNDSDGCKEGDEYTVTGDDGETSTETVNKIANVEDYALGIEDPPINVLDEMSEDQIATWEDFKTSFAELKELQENYATAKLTLVDLEEGLVRFEKEAVAAVAEARETMESIMSSPFLLPGLWAAMIPSMIPYFGGLMPIPWPGGPPSTIPGMIYLVLMFLDAFEENTHDSIEEKKGQAEEGALNCENEL